jgi:hypothetical protein
MVRKEILLAARRETISLPLFSLWGSLRYAILFSCLTLRLQSLERMRSMDRAAIFTEITRLNALRRESGLPLYNVRQEFDRLVAREEWRAYREYRLTFSGLYEQVRNEVLQERGIADLKTMSSFARMGIGAEVTRRFDAELSKMGINKPRFPDKK